MSTLNPNEIERKQIVFISNSFNPNPKFSGRNFPQSESVPATDEILEIDPKSKQEVRRLIRYVPGEPSIYAEEQSDNAVNPKTGRARLGKIKLSEGSKIVTNLEVTLLEYLRKCDYNGNKKDRDPRKNVLFFEDIPGKHAQDHVKNDMKITEIKWKLHQMSKSELEMHAMILGVPYKGLYTDDLKADLLMRADGDPSIFDKIADEEGSRIIFDVTKAIDEKIIYVNESENSIHWDTGKLVVRAPISENPEDHLVDYINTDAGQMIYEEIKRQLYPGEQPQIGGKSVQQVAEKEVLKHKTNESLENLLSAAIDSGVVIKNFQWYKLDSTIKGDEYYNFAMGKTKALKFLEENEAFRILLQEKIASLAGKV
jgi:hypothetical protein